MEGNRIIFR